jgi:hypothetical protein
MPPAGLCTVGWQVAEHRLPHRWPQLHGRRSTTLRGAPQPAPCGPVPVTLRDKHHDAREQAAVLGGQGRRDAHRPGRADQVILRASPDLPKVVRFRR